MVQPTLSEGHITGPLDAEARLQASCAYGQIVEEEPETGLRRVKHPPVTGEDRKNVGSVRFELTIDGSLRHASVLQRVITDQETHCSSCAKTAGARRHSWLGHDPPLSILSTSWNIRIVLEETSNHISVVYLIYIEW
jgi:hypothetical protein